MGLSGFQSFGEGTQLLECKMELGHAAICLLLYPTQSCYMRPSVDETGAQNRSEGGLVSFAPGDVLRAKHLVEGSGLSGIS